MNMYVRSVKEDEETQDVGDCCDIQLVIPRLAKVVGIRADLTKLERMFYLISCHCIIMQYADTCHRGIELTSANGSHLFSLCVRQPTLSGRSTFDCWPGVNGQLW
jgi:hypothetical protein